MVDGKSLTPLFGSNGSIGQAALSTAKIWRLFGDSSPHSNYYCEGSNCNFNK